MINKWPQNDQKAIKQITKNDQTHNYLSKKKNKKIHWRTLSAGRGEKKENSREQCHSCNGQAVSQPQQAQRGSLPSRFLPRPNGPKRPQNKMRYFVLRDADYFWSYDPSENYNPYSFLRLLAWCWPNTQKCCHLSLLRPSNPFGSQAHATRLRS